MTTPPPRPIEAWKKKLTPWQFRKMSPTDRFLSHVIKTDGFGCWDWNGAKSTQGYGCMYANGKIVRAHRFSWNLYRGPIPNGIDVLHTCDNTSCSNPDHLYLGTDKDNARDKVQRGRSRNGRESKTCCPKGHPYDYICPRGYRNCKTCRREQLRSLRNSRTPQPL